MSYIAEKLREHSSTLVRLNRQDQLKRMGGKVVERDAAKRKVRLELGTDAETGAKVLSPWLRVQSMSAGAFKAFVLPSLGEQMYMESAGGIVGADSMATYGTFDDEHQHPAQDENELVIENGDSRFSMKSGEVKVKSGNTEFKFTPGGFVGAATQFDWNQA